MNDLRFSLPVLIVSLAVVGCGGGQSTAPAPTEPSETSSVATDPGMSAGAPAEVAGGLCAEFRETVGSLPTPKGEDEIAEFEESLAAAEQAYIDGIRTLAVDPADQGTLDEFVSVQEKLADARASYRAEPDPDGGGVEGGADAAELTTEAERLASELGIPGCAGV